MLLRLHTEVNNYRDQMKYTTDQRGAMAVLVVILVALLAVAGGLAIYNVTNARNSREAFTSPSTTAKSTPAEDPYAGWKTYTSKQESLSFKYPSDMAIVSSGAVDPAGDGVTLSDASGLTIAWSSAVDGLGGACHPDTAPHLYIHAVTKVPAVSPAQAIELGLEDDTERVALTDGTLETSVPLKVGDTGTCGYYSLFKSKDGRRNMWLQGYRSVSGKRQALNVQQVQLLKQVILSATYAKP